MSSEPNRYCENSVHLNAVFLDLPSLPMKIFSLQDNLLFELLMLVIIIWEFNQSIKSVLTIWILTLLSRYCGKEKTFTQLLMSDKIKNWSGQLVGRHRVKLPFSVNIRTRQLLIIGASKQTESVTEKMPIEKWSP